MYKTYLALITYTGLFAIKPNKQNKKTTSESLRTSATVIAIAANVYNTVILNHMQPGIEKICKKIKMV